MKTLLLLRRSGLTRATMLSAMLAALPITHIAAASPAVCYMRLSVELTPDVPNPRDAGFLSSLLSNQVSYRVTLLEQRSGSDIVIELTGPGPEYRCEDVLQAMRNDARVLSIHLEQETS